MEEKQSILKNKKLLIIIPVLVLIVAVVGVTYAFFNYTRTGGTNNLGTGSIYFLATESNERINITNFFPTATGAQPDGSNSGSMTIAVEAGTSYEYGIDYSLKAVNVSIPSGVTNIPVKVTTSAVNDTGKDIGFSGVTAVTLTDNVGLGTGHVAGKANGGVSGNRETGTITVTAYIDAADVAISDTYNGEETANMGTTTEWVRGRTVITTTEWNRLATTPITFKVKVEAGQGSASAQAAGTIASCPGCKFIYSSNDYNGYNYGTNGTPVANITENVSRNYNDVITNDRKYFLINTVNGTPQITPTTVVKILIIE